MYNIIFTHHHSLGWKPCASEKQNKKGNNSILIIINNISSSFMTFV